jgi:adenosine deaminase
MIDLHRHLDGSLRPETLTDLARDAGVAIDPTLRFHAGMGLEAALSCFAMTLSVLQSPRAVWRVAHEMCDDAEAEGVTTLEIRFAPQLHLGGTIDAIVDAALQGIEGRAGLILCGLYGEPPQSLEYLVKVARNRPGVVGLDLAGGPAPGARWGMADYARAFEQARDLGLGRTVHAGEGRPPAEIRVAIEQLHAQRIGHGTTLLDDPAVVALVMEKGVTIEACVTSNLHVGAIASLEDHPLSRWLDLGVRATICTDNVLFSQVDAPEEYARVAALPGMTAQKVARTIRYGREAAFRRG